MTILGTIGVTGAIRYLDARRDTDLGNARDNITSLANKVDKDLELPPIQFVDVAVESGIVMVHGPGGRRRLLTEDTGSGLAWGDYDDDGDFDLYIVNFDRGSAASAIANSAADDSSGKQQAQSVSSHLYRNDGNHFVDVTDHANVGDEGGCGMGAWFVDFDNDGDQDLYVTKFGPNQLFENQGDGTFLETAQQRGLDDNAWSTGVAWGDFDRDGLIDLYVCNYLEYEGVSELAGSMPASMINSEAVPFALNPNAFDPQPNRLFRNLGNGRFEDVAEQLQVSDPGGRSLAATFCDLDGDGWLDLYVNNDVSTNRCFVNRCRGQSEAVDGEDLAAFEDYSTLSGSADPRGSMGLSVAETGDMNDQWDGQPDLFITHWIAQENALYQSCGASTVLFNDKTRQFRLGEVSLSAVGWGCGFADFDLDGRQDLIVANGSTLESKADLTMLVGQAPFLFWNEGRYYLEMAEQVGGPFANRYSARGLALADFDDDGDPDAAVSRNGDTPLLLRNDTPARHHWLKIRLVGPAAAKFGARVLVRTQHRNQLAWYGSDSSYLSMHATELIFGLGEAENVDQIEVRWSDGNRSAILDAAPGRIDILHSLSMDPANPN